jgi:L-fucose isomerase-like protein
MKTNIAAVGLAHPFEVGYDDAPNLLNKTVYALGKIGIDCKNTNVIMHDLTTVKEASEALKSSDADVILICIATWSEDHHLLDLLSYIDKPVILRAYPAFDTGSLCCAHQIGAVFTDIGKKYEFVYGDADDEGCANETANIAKAYALKTIMSRTRVGAIGGRVKGMTEIAYDEFSIKEKLGARVVNLDEKEMLEKVEAITDAEAEKILEEKKDVLAPCKILSSKESMIESIKYYKALKDLAAEYDLEALSVKCYTTYMGKICLGYSLLAEEGIVGSCEGDVTNALTMKLMYELSGKPINNTDLLYPDEKANTILFAHCGSSGFSIAEGDVELCPVRLAETGVCTKFLVKPGKVTAVNICGHGDKFRLSAMVGDAVPCGMEFPGNPVKIKFEKDVTQISKEIMANGVGHHWMVAYGDYMEELKNFCKINDILMYEI